MGMEVIQRLANQPVEYRGQRVITLAQMDEAHDRPEGTAGRAFRKHKDKLVEGEHYFRIPRGELTTLNVVTPRNLAEDLIALTERGYLLLVKTFRDELAWQIQDRLIDCYFAVRAMASVIPIGFQEELRQLIASEVRSVVNEVRDKQAEPHYTIRERCQDMGWYSVTRKQLDKIRNLTLVKLRRRNYPRPERDGMAPGAELLFPASQCHIVDEAIIQIWEEVRFHERGGMFN